MFIVRIHLSAIKNYFSCSGCFYCALPWLFLFQNCDLLAISLCFCSIVFGFLLRFVCVLCCLLIFYFSALIFLSLSRIVLLLLIFVVLLLMLLFGCLYLFILHTAALFVLFICLFGCINPTLFALYTTVCILALLFTLPSLLSVSKHGCASNIWVLFW